jgi:hypothetical protein
MTETELAGSAAVSGTRRRAGFRRLLAKILFIAGGCCGIIGAVAVTGVRSVR